MAITPTKIITHAGTFHADELCAVALLQILFPFAAVERTYTPTEEDFNDPSVVVVDIGRRYEPHLNNYDHHQDANLPASNMLVLQNFLVGSSGKLAFLLEKHFFRYISDVDTGKIVENENGQVSPPTISGIIRAMNSLSGDDNFYRALTIMSEVLRGQIENANARILAEKLWREAFKEGQVAIWDGDEFLVGWQDWAAEDGVNYLVSKNLRGGYQITSRDSRTRPIPPDPRQTFLHNSRFIASYPTRAEAISHALSL